MNCVSSLEQVFQLRPAANRRPIVVSLSDACFLLGISRATIYRRQSEDSFPKIIKNGRKSQFRLSELEAWANGH